VVIRPGQFAFLLTEEVVNIPSNTIALISMRAGLKFRGLMNVSGFHVDPGFKGKLIFGVYNAGPAEIYIARGAEVFLIVFAELDGKATEGYNGEAKFQDSIPTDLVQKMTGQVFSPVLLQRQMGELMERHRDVEKDLASMKGRDFFHVSLAGIALAFIGVGFAVLVAIATSDWAKAAVGMWLDDAIHTYEKNASTVAASQNSAKADPSVNASLPASAGIPQQSSGVAPPKSASTVVPAGSAPR
jgi:dCTP deaminase